MLRSLGADAIVYLLYDRWSLRRKPPRRMAGRSLPMSPLRSGDPEIHGTTTGRDRWDRLNLVKKMLELWLNYVELWLSCCGRDVWFETVMKGTNKSFISCVMYVMWVMFFFSVEACWNWTQPSCGGFRVSPGTKCQGSGWRHIDSEK